MGARGSTNAVHPAVLDPRRPVLSKAGTAVTAAGDGVGFVLSEAERKRVLTAVYNIPNAEAGRGHYGVVKIATHKETGESVAVKSVPKRRAVYLEMLRAEVDILRSVSHINIIKLIDVFEDETEVHMVFETCSGGELFEPIANRQFRFSEFEAARITRKVLQSLEHIHALNVVHRDLKPENILFSLPGVVDSEIKVIDFGLATFAMPREILRKHVGTPYYIAPEVIGKQYNRECDVWSLGVILFTLLCGYPPFWGDTEREIYGRVKRGHFAFDGPEWQARSLSSKDLVHHLLIMYPDARFTVAQALKHPWIVFEGQQPPAPGTRQLFHKLRLFASFSLLKRLGILVLARELPDEELLRAGDWFRSIDSTCSGFIAEEDLMGMARVSGYSLNESEASVLISDVGILRERVVSFHEFAAAVMPRTQYLNEKYLMTMFQGLDADGDGMITQKDLHTLLGDGDGYAASILIDSDIDPEVGLGFGEYFRVICGSEILPF